MCMFLAGLQRASWGCSAMPFSASSQRRLELMGWPKIYQSKPQVMSPQKQHLDVTALRIDVCVWNDLERQEAKRLALASLRPSFRRCSHPMPKAKSTRSKAKVKEEEPAEAAVPEDFHQRVYTIVRSIPEGRVSSSRRYSSLAHYKLTLEMYHIAGLLLRYHCQAPALSSSLTHGRSSA